MASFEQPVGPLADLSELLYVTALQQACMKLRIDVTITPEDISLFLGSRYGVMTTPEVVEQFILKDISGIMAETKAKVNDKASEDVTCKMDLVELVALLFIPQFLKMKANKEDTKDVQVCSDSFSCVTDAIIHDVSTVTDSNETQLELTQSLIRNIFLSYGETALASNDTLINDMFQAARRGKDPDEKVYFDQETFLRALTHDIGLYSIKREAQMSTNWNDVFGEDAPVVGDVCPITGKERIQKEEAVSGIRNKFIVARTAGEIDMVAHTYFCRVQMIMNWLFFVFTYFGYIYVEVPTLSHNCPEFTALSTWIENKDSASCSMGYTIVDWLISFALACTAGFLFVLLGALGNDLKIYKWHIAVFTMLFLIFLTLFFPVMYGFGAIKPIIFLRIASLGFGTVATVFRMRHILNLFGYKEGAHFTSLRNESQSKQACAFKVAGVQKNAITVHEKPTKESAIQTYYGKAFTNFSKLDIQFVRRCGLGDVFGGVWSGKIFTEDGIFYSGRHIAGNVAQWIMCVFIFGCGLFFTMQIKKSWIAQEDRDDQVASSLDFAITLAADQLLVQEAVELILKRFILFVLRVLYFLYNAGVLQLDCILLGTFLEGFCQRSIFDEEDDGEFACSLFAGGPEALCKIMDPFFRPASATGNPVSLDEMVSMINATDLVAPVMTVVSRAVSDNISHQLNKLYPEHRFMVVTPFAVGTAAAFLCSITIALWSLPSITATTFKLRSGLIRSVTDPERRPAYLQHVNKGTNLFGSMFWGILASSLLIGVFAGSIVFFCTWQVTAFMAARLLSMGVGISVTLLLKWLVTRTCRVNLYQGLYRRNPLMANIAELLNESFNFATSVFFAIVRMVKLLFLTAYYVGRPDARFLEPSIGRYFHDNFVIDIVPDYFIADILITEAHRHPYIESLGAVYLYKLKYGESFISRAGSAWRLLFVTALMPWLQKYRFEAKGKGCMAVPKKMLQRGESQTQVDDE